MESLGRIDLLIHINLDMQTECNCKPLNYFEDRLVLIHLIALLELEL